MPVIPTWWTDPYPEVASVAAALAYLDAVGAALMRGKSFEGFVLSTGAQEIVRADTEAEIDTFVLGFALAHVICERRGLIGRLPGTDSPPPPPPPPPPEGDED